MVIPFLPETKSPPQEQTTPTLGDVIKEAMRTVGDEMRVCLPAKVLSYDHKTQKAKVQPQMRRQYRDGATDEMPPVYEVPVAHPRAGSAIVHMPIKVGDNVMLVFADRSMDKWLVNGETLTPDDERQHHLTDAIAYPGLYPFSDSENVANPDDLILKNSEGDSKMEIRLTPTDQVQFLNKGDELVLVLDDLLTALREAVVYSSAGPLLLRHSKFDSLQTRLRRFLKRDA